MKDSGQRETFDSGAVRDTDDDKPRPDLISPFMLERLGRWLKAGADKYGEHNWQKGLPVSRCIASLYRHLMYYMQSATGEDYLCGVIANATFIVHYEEMIRRGLLPPSLLDMPKYRRPSSYYDNVKIVASQDGPIVKLEVDEPVLYRTNDDET
jgi:hypothetical protein